MRVIAVASTGIYCRDGCPAPPPAPRNVSLVASVEVARAAGYRACKRCRPDDLDTRPTHGAAAVEVVLPYRGRRDLSFLFGFLSARAIAGVESFGPDVASRTLRLPHGGGVVRLEARPGRVRCRSWVESESDAAAAIAAVRSLLDLDTDLGTAEAALAADPEMARLMRGHRGRGVPGTVDGSELAVRAVLGQQISVAGARTLAARLVARFGSDLPPRDDGTEGEPAPTRLFPSPDVLAEADVASIGMPRSRAAAVRHLARALAEGRVSLSASAEPDHVRESLLALPGIGSWTATYITMRVQHDADAFLPSDLGVRKAMVALGVSDDPRSIERRAEAWRPWRAYAQQHLWASLGA